MMLRGTPPVRYTTSTLEEDATKRVKLSMEKGLKRIGLPVGEDSPAKVTLT